jgi:hypothetical protein
LLAYVTLDQATEIEAKSAGLAKDIAAGVAGTGKASVTVFDVL